ncbi:hypothetical protein GU90_05755 [Saccharopolyspora rectivirgula]|uniref:Uncharacterized protein n=1 Tax=Saccharopolyspora rectivirgula TaxID=28042 RepID=A0A073AZU2_9PSEU|nr:hypothetical protein GU90_05755 [Saccharopolyspora rectivirgula]
MVSWVRRGEGLVGWGAVAWTRVRGRDRFAADTRWQEVLGRMRSDDPLELPSSGPVAFTILAFADEPGDSAVLVPAC